MILDGFCKCGCGKLTGIATKNRKDTGWVKGAPKKFINHHGNGKDFMSLIEYGDNGCWNWKGKIAIHGYGKWHGDKYAHRLVYEKIKGKIPHDKVLDHLCKNRSCVNPDHLEVVKEIENIRRAAKLYSVSIAQIDDLRNFGFQWKEIAKLCGTRIDALIKKFHGRTWKLC